MIYELRHFNTSILRFTATEDSSTPDIDIIWTNQEHLDLLPLDLTLSGEGLTKWIKHRIIPKNRAYVQNFLSKCGLHLNRPMNIIRVSKGLSLNDCCWIVEEGFEDTFEKYNLYDKRFSKILAQHSLQKHILLTRTKREYRWGFQFWIKVRTHLWQLL